MPKRALWRLSATEMQGRYRDGSLTPLEVAQACLARLETVNPRLNAVVARRDPASWRRRRPRPSDSCAAPAVAARRDPAVGEGQPVHRRSVDHLGLPGAARTRDRARRALGRPGTGRRGADHRQDQRPEFALEGYTANPIFGVTRNPWNLELTPVVPPAAGWPRWPPSRAGDRAGRRRFDPPAGFAYGSRGTEAFPELGAAPARTAQPAAGLRGDRTAGPHRRRHAHAVPGDARPGFGGPFLACGRAGAHAAATATALRILYVERFGAAPLDPQIAASVAQAVDRLAALGHQVQRGALPLDLDFYADEADRPAGLANCSTGSPTGRHRPRPSTWRWRRRAGSSRPPASGRSSSRSSSCGATAWRCSRTSTSSCFLGRRASLEGGGRYPTRSTARRSARAAMPSTPAGSTRPACPPGAALRALARRAAHRHAAGGPLRQRRHAAGPRRRLRAAHPWADRWPAC